MNSYFQCSCQYDNLGDLLINKLLVDELGRYGKVYVDASGAPDRFAEALLRNEQAVDASNSVAAAANGVSRRLALAKFLRSNHVRLIADSPGPTFSSTYINGIRLWNNRLRNLLLRMSGIKVVNIGKCCSNLIADGNDFRDTFANSYLMRSEASVAHVAESIGQERVRFVPDLCFLMNYMPGVTAQNKRRIALFDIRLTNDHNELLNWCRQLASDFIAQSFDVIVYYQVESDRPAAMRLFESIADLGVQIRRELVWYDDLGFFADKMFVVSNRLHSLLCGAAYGAFPICMYQETPKTLKLRHVMESSFRSELPVLYENGNKPKGNLTEFYKLHEGKLAVDFERNALMCRSAVSDMLNCNANIRKQHASIRKH